MPTRDTEDGSNLKRYCKRLALTRQVIEDGYADWKSCKSGKKNGWRVRKEYGAAAALLDEIEREIRDRSLTFRPLHSYDRADGTSGKVRHITVESVKQQVCDHIAVGALMPMLRARVGRQQYGSTKGRGAVAAKRRVERYIQRHRHFVHMDVRHCYESMLTDMVMGILERYVACEWLLYLVGALLSTYGGCLILGSFLCLRLAQLVLSFGYHHTESLGKLRRGQFRALVSKMLWYADDVYLFADSKRDLRMAERSLERYLAGFGLALKPWKICRCDQPCKVVEGRKRPVAEPCDIAGFRVWRDHVALRERIYLHAVRAFGKFSRRPTDRIARRACSLWGYLKHSDSRGTCKSRGIPQLLSQAKAYS